MKSFCCLFCSLLVLASADGVTLNESTLPNSEFADLEASKHYVITPPELGKSDFFKIDMTFCGSSLSNNYEIALGNSDSEGELPAENIDFILGISCGTWFLRERGLRRSYICTNDFVKTGTKRLQLAIRYDATGVPHTLSFTDSGKPFQFPGLDISAPSTVAWLQPAWTDIKLTRRGYVADPSEEIRVSIAADGATIIIR